MADTTTRGFSTALRQLRRLRQPEYTGENRCYACTFVNLVFAEIVAIAIGTWSIPAGIAVFVAASTVVYLRGYLVPGTPELTRRYLPEPILRLFGKDGAQFYGVVVDDPSPDASTSTLTFREAGIVTDTAAGREQASEGEDENEDDTVQLAPPVSAALSEQYGYLNADLEADVATRLASAFGVDPASVTAVSPPTAYRVDGHLIRWESRLALHVDLALAPTLADQFDDWGAQSVSERTKLLAAGRACLDDCPACESAFESSVLVAGSCCRDLPPLLSIRCDTCGVQLVERDADEVEATVGGSPR